VALVHQLRRRRPKGRQRSLREISAQLALRDFMKRARECILCGIDFFDARSEITGFFSAAANK